jgi:hypothetical protein
MQCRERTHENSLKVKVCSVLEGFCIPISISAAQIGSNLDPRSYRIVSCRVEVVRELGRCSVPKRKVRVAHVSKRPLVSACLGQRLSVTKVGKRELGPGLAVSHQLLALSPSLSLSPSSGLGRTRDSRESWLRGRVTSTHGLPGLAGRSGVLPDGGSSWGRETKKRVPSCAAFRIVR